MIYLQLSQEPEDGSVSRWDVDGRNRSNVQLEPQLQDEPLPEQPQSPFILMVVWVWVVGGEVLKLLKCFFVGVV